MMGEGILVLIKLVCLIVQVIVLGFMIKLIWKIKSEDD